jgi:hypothetical protein
MRSAGFQKAREETYNKMTLQRMMMSKWKMLAMPSAKQRIMQSTPVLMCMLALAQSSRLSSNSLRVPLSVYTYNNEVSRYSRLYANGSVRGSSLLKFRDLNSSASVMTGEDVKCGSEVVTWYASNHKGCTAEDGGSMYV